MAKLQEYNGLFCESEFECAFIAFLQDEGWEYLLGNNVKRVNKRDVLIEDDFKEFIARTNPDLEEAILKETRKTKIQRDKMIIIILFFFLIVSPALSLLI